MKFRIRSVNVSCSTTSSRNGRLNIVEIELRSSLVAGREAGVGIDHHQDEHGGKRRDRGVGDSPGGEPLQQEHEQRKHHQEMEQVCQVPAQRAEILPQLVMAECRRQQQQRRQQQRAEAQRVLRDPLARSIGTA